MRPGTVTRTLATLAAATVAGSSVVGAVAWETNPSLGRMTGLASLMLALLAVAVLAPRARRSAAVAAATLAAAGGGLHALGIHSVWLSPLVTCVIVAVLAVAILVAPRWPVLGTGLGTAAAAGTYLVLIALLVGAETVYEPLHVPGHAGVTVPAGVALFLLGLAWSLRRTRLDDPHVRTLAPGLAGAALAVPVVAFLLGALDVAPNTQTALLIFVAATGPTLAATTAATRSGRLTRLLAQVQEILLNETSYAMLLVDPDGAIVRANPAARAFLGASADELTGTSIESFLPGELRGHHARWRAVYLADPTPRPMGMRSDLELVRADGERRRVRIALTPIPQIAGPPLVAVSIMDVTELARKAAHAEAHARSLEATLAQEHASLNRLRDLDRAKDLLLTAISHEVRTPLTVLIGMTGLLADPDTVLAPDVAARMQERVHVQARRLNALVEDLLDLDRFQEGTIASRPEDVRVDAIVRRAADTASAAYGRRVEVDAPKLTARFDPRHLERILDNLLSNACRYAPNGPIHVDAALDESGDRVHVAVEDHGPGVRPHQREAIFEAFTRGDRIDPAQPGVGIGLALVRRLAAANGGSCHVESGARAGGARFVVDLPVSAAADAVGPFDHAEGADVPVADARVPS